MRELKFRAWDEEEKRFWYFTLEDVLKRNMNYKGSWDEKILKGEKQQYTNLKDENGKEIYEGDILKVKSDDGTINLYVKYDTDMGEYLLIKEEEWEDSLYGCMCFNEVEVVGNIYENEDLLKQND